MRNTTKEVRVKHSLREKQTGYIAGVVFALLSTILAPAGIIAPAQASASAYDVNGRTLQFNAGTVYRPSLSSPFNVQEFETGETIDQVGGASRSPLGGNLQVGDYIDYYNVTSFSSGSSTISIDARLAIVEIVNMVAAANTWSDVVSLSTGTAGYIAMVDDDEGTATSYQILTEFQTGPRASNSPEQRAYVAYSISFWIGLEDVSASPTAVSLSNLALTVEDIDADQYIEATNYTSYKVTDPTSLSVTTSASFTRFQGSSAGASSPISQNQARVTLIYESAVHEISLRLGEFDPNNSGGSFDLSFDLGPSFTLPTQTIESPVIAASRPPVQAPRNVPYEGPLNLRHSGAAICSGGDATITGLRLDTIKEVTVAGTPTTFEMLADGNLKYSLKDVPAGKHQVKFWVPINGLYLTDQITVSTCSTTPAVTGPGAFSASKLFANYRGDRGPVIARDRAAITAFINQYKGITTVRCVGSTSGVPAKRTDPALARARAKNACDIVKTLVPNATYTLETSTGKGVGQRFRSVTILISGTN